MAFSSACSVSRSTGEALAEESSLMELSFGEEVPQLEFRSVEAFEKWFSAERAKWEWLTPTNAATNVGNAPQLVQSHVNDVVNLANQAKAQPDPLGWLKPQLDARWGPAGHLRYSDGKEGAAILDIRDAAGDEAAAFAYAFVLRQVNVSNTANRNQLRGVLLLALPEMSDAADLSERLSKERRNFKAAQASAIARIDKAHQEQQERIDNLIARGRRVARDVLRSRYDDWNAARDKWKAEADQSKQEIDSVRVAYEESMRLQGPVKYWSLKARTHGTNEKWATLYVALFFIVGGAGLVAAFVVAGDFILTSSREAIAAGTPQPTALYVLLTGGLAALTTLTFWIGRLLTKLWLSEHHLRNDAHERAVMTTTYLALTREERAADADRQIILSALFRNTPDGIVKEEGAADIGLQAVIAKYLAKP